MRNIIKDYVAIAARLLPLPDPIYEFGSSEGVAAFRAAGESWRLRAATSASLGERLLPPILYRLDRRFVKHWRAWRGVEKR